MKLKVLLPLLVTLSMPAFALDCSYGTYIDKQDLYNSQGNKLTNVGQIIRQDRANIYKPKPALGDVDDCGYDKAANRAKLEKIINASYIEPAIKKRIRQGDVFIEVNINRGRATVFLDE